MRDVELRVGASSSIIARAPYGHPRACHSDIQMEREHTTATYSHYHITYMILDIADSILTFRSRKN